MPALDRRDFCTLSSLALLGLPPHLLARDEHMGQQRERALVLYREAHTASRSFAAHMAEQGWQTCMLKSDLVRQWRDELGARLEQGWLLLGQGDWDDWLLLRGLAAEQRHFPLHEQRLSVTLYSWVLG